MAERALDEPADTGIVQERILELRQVPALRTLGARVLADVARAAEVESLPAGAVLMRQGERARGVTWVLRGSTVWREGDRALGRSEDGASVGLLDLLAGAEARATATAQGEVIVARVERDRFIELLEDSFELVEALLAAIASELCAAGVRTLSRAPSLALVSEGLPAELDFTEKLVRLRMSRPFVRAPIRALATFAQRGEVRRWARGATLWERGAPSREVVVVLAGEVREGTATRGCGETLGLIEALAGRRRGAAASAKTPLVAHVLEIEALADVLEDDEELALELLRVSADELLAHRIERGLSPDLTSGAPDRSLPRVARAGDTTG